MIKAAISDKDPRVRISAIRALGAVRDQKAAVSLLERGEQLDVSIGREMGDVTNPNDTSEFFEIVTTLGRIMANSNDKRAIAFYEESRFLVYEPEVEIAFARTAPTHFSLSKFHDEFFNRFKERDSIIAWKWYSAFSLGLAEVATAPDEPKNAAARKLRQLISNIETANKHIARLYPEKLYLPLPDILRAYAAFKSPDLGEVLARYLRHKDVITRSTAAELIGDQPNSKQNIEALKTAFTRAMLIDKRENDAQLAILDSLYKLDKKEAVGSLLVALNAPDYLVRKKAFERLADKDLQKDFPGIITSLENARAKKKDQVLPYNPASRTMLGQVLSNNADYRSTVSRKNGTVKAVLTTQKGTFTIDLLPEDAPLTVDSFVRLAKSKYFDGLAVHRVVPNFVMQDGDPRGDGNGGPGWSIRCEINMVPFERGSVGMALSGKDTGGSQWFAAHSPQPHLDGGYTVFGKVNETGMKVVDNIVRGDRIMGVRIIENRSK